MRRGLVEPEAGTAAVEDYSQPLGWFHEGQNAAWSSRATELAIIAGNQSGKTAFLAPYLRREIQRCAPLIRMLGTGDFIYAGPTLQLLGAQAIPQFRRLFESESKLGRLVQGNKPKFHFSAEGSARIVGFSAPITVHFAYTNDSSNLESLTAQGGLWDEAGQKENKQDSFEAYNRRLGIARATTFGLMLEWLERAGLVEQFQWWIDRYCVPEGLEATFGRRCWGTTPYEWNWFKTQVYDRAERAILDGDRLWELLNFPTWMNPLHSEAECLSHLDTMPEWKWLMMYKGIYTKPAGLVFDCFEDVNVIPPFAIPKSWKRWLGVDFGGINTAAVIYAEEPDSGNLIQFAEYHPARSLTFEEHAKAIVSLAGCVPTGAGGSHQEEGWREAFSKNGIPLDEPPENEVTVQVGCVYTEIKTRKLLIFRTCAKTIAQFQSFSYVLDESLEPTDKYQDEHRYHLLAASRYIVTKLRPPKAHRPAVSSPSTTLPSPLADLEPKHLANAALATKTGAFIPPPEAPKRRGF